MRHRGWIRWGLRLLGPCLLVMLLAQTDLKVIGDAMGRLHGGAFAGAVACWLLNAGLKGLRWQRLLDAQGIALPAARAQLWYMGALFLGGVSPGRLGELAKATLVRDMGHPLGRALFASVMDRLLDVIVLPLALVVGAIFYGGMLGAELGSLALGTLGAVLLVTVCWRARRLLIKPLQGLLDASTRARARVTTDDFLREMRHLRVTLGLSLAGLTMACWVIYGAALGCLAWGIGLDVSILYVGLVALLAALAGLVPVTVSGVGTRDAVFAVLLSREGVSLEDAIALATLTLGLHLVVLLVQLPCYLVAFGKQAPVHTE